MVFSIWVCDFTSLDKLVPETKKGLTWCFNFFLAKKCIISTFKISLIIEIYCLKTNLNKKYVIITLLVGSNSTFILRHSFTGDISAAALGLCKN